MVFPVGDLIMLLRRNFFSEAALVGFLAFLLAAGRSVSTESHTPIPTSSSMGLRRGARKNLDLKTAPNFQHGDSVSYYDLVLNNNIL